MVVTGSWDKTIKYWDLRSPTPVGTVECQDKIYSMDVKEKLLVVATDNKQFRIIDLSNPMTVLKSIDVVQLKHQTRVVSCFPDASGFAVGTIEGKCALRSVNKPESDGFVVLNFSF